MLIYHLSYPAYKHMCLYEIYEQGIRLFQIYPNTPHINTCAYDSETLLHYLIE